MPFEKGQKIASGVTFSNEKHPYKSVPTPQREKTVSRFAELFTQFDKQGWGLSWPPFLGAYSTHFIYMGVSHLKR
jgi:hypothetical protein